MWRRTKSTVGPKKLFPVPYCNDEFFPHHRICCLNRLYLFIVVPQESILSNQSHWKSEKQEKRKNP